MTDFASRHCAEWPSGQMARDLPAPERGRNHIHVLWGDDTYIYEIAPHERLAFLYWLAIVFPVDLPDLFSQSLDMQTLEKLLGATGVAIFEP